MKWSLVGSLGWIAFLAPCLCLAAPLNAHQSAQSALDIPQLVRDAVFNEAQARKRPAHYYRYEERETDLKGSETFEVVESPRGPVERLLTVNGKLPSQKQRHKNETLLENLPHDENLQRSRLKEQQNKIVRRMNVLEQLPEAFVFESDGTEPDTRFVRLKFQPNPHFQPRSEEGRVLMGMEGVLVIDPQTRRLTEMEGTLIRDVAFGWGFAVRLRRGGHFTLVQSRLPDGDWQVTHLTADFDGKMFVIKTLKVRDKEQRHAFEPVPDNISIAAAVKMLQEEPAVGTKLQLASNSNP